MIFVTCTCIEKKAEGTCTNKISKQVRRQEGRNNVIRSKKKLRYINILFSLPRSVTSSPLLDT